MSFKVEWFSITERVPRIGQLCFVSIGFHSMRRATVIRQAQEGQADAWLFPADNGDDTVVDFSPWHCWCAATDFESAKPSGH